MPTKNVVSTLTAADTTETNKKLIDTVTVPQGYKWLTAVSPQPVAGMAGMTTLENVGGIIELESDDMSGWQGTQQFLTDTMAVLTSGVGVVKPAPIPCMVAVNGGGKIKVSYTGDLALTINNKIRVGLQFST